MPMELKTCAARGVHKPGRAQSPGIANVNVDLCTPVHGI